MNGNRWKDRIIQFIELNGAREVHRSWRDNMLLQGRYVDNDRMDWDTLSTEDKELDRAIAHDIITDFMVWLEAHIL